MKQLLIITLLLSIFSVSAFSQKDKKNKGNKGEMKTYYLVLLKKGPVRGQDSTSTARIQDEHMKHIEEMSKSGKLAIAGPIEMDKELRGIFIFDVKTYEEAENLVKEDPAVKAGRLIYEIYPWMSVRGSKLP